MTPHCDFDLEDSKSVSSNDTLARDDASLCKVCFRSVSSSEDIIRTEGVNLSCDLDLGNSNPIFSLVSSTYDRV